MFKGHFTLVCCLAGTLFSCHEVEVSPYKNITKESFADMYEPAFEINPQAIRCHIDTLIRADSGAFRADQRTRTYYNTRRPFIWINRNGILGRADTALAYMEKAADCGLDTAKLRLSQITRDIRLLRNLSVFKPGNGINKLMARVEYNLTRAFLRYSAGQMFGFVNPDRLYNNLEKCDSDTVSGRVKYSHLCDLRTLRPDSSFFATAISKAFNDSVGEFISAVQPKNRLYEALKKMLKNAAKASPERKRILCNIERCRWRQRGFKDIHSYENHVVVNVPSFSLRAAKAGKTLHMRVAVGTTSNKTPLLSSWIMRMDINPQWIIPKSIAKGITGKTGFMRSEGMFVYDKKRGKLPPEYGSYSKIMDGEQFLIQAGGPKNPLGRVIFRFNNDFSVFLHDTSSPWLFQRSKRTLSHGCVRVEKPLELALFLIEDDGELQERIKYSMTMPFVNDGDSLDAARIDKKRLINNVDVKPAVPIFITYYTIFYDGDDRLIPFDDIYGYDDALYKELAPFNK